MFDTAARCMEWDPTVRVSRRQVENLAGQAASMRQAMFAGPRPTGTYNGTPLAAMVSAVVSRRELVDGGFELEHAAILRVCSTGLALAPALGDAWVDFHSGRTYRVAEIRRGMLTPEWMLGLAQV